MRQFRLSTVITTLTVIVLAGSSLTAMSGHSREDDFKASLNGSHEVPVINTNATARLRAELNGDETELMVTLQFDNLSANAAASHFHLGQTHTNGAVVAFICGGGGQAACPAATSGEVTATITAANILAVPAQGVNAGDFASFVRQIRLGNTYANIHNARFPTGEVRGQVRDD
jgi:hypothetical protein